MDLETDYARAGFGGSLVPGERPALLLIDVARAYLEPSSPLYAGVEAAFEAMRRLAAAARATATPAVFTRVEYSDPREGGLFRRKIPALAAFERGNPLGDFDPRLAPGPGDIVITKHFPSAFFGTPLAAMLAAERIDTLLICGFSTSGCVRASALDALCLGFVPIVVTDAVGDRSADVHRANLFDLAAKTAMLVSEAGAAGLLAGAAPTA
jgi:maleamate amidohydrolase